MRGILYVLTTIAVVALGFWAYQENYRTQTAMRELRGIHAEIGAAHARLNMLRAEWAYLNRPDRLRDLAGLNYDKLELLPLAPESFGRIDDLPEPLPELLPLTDPVVLTSAGASVNDEEDPL